MIDGELFVVTMEVRSRVFPARRRNFGSTVPDVVGSKSGCVVQYLPLA